MYETLAGARAIGPARAGAFNALSQEQLAATTFPFYAPLCITAGADTWLAQIRRLGYVRRGAASACSAILARRNAVAGARVLSVRLETWNHLWIETWGTFEID